MEDLTSRLERIGLADAKVKEILKNEKVAAALGQIAQEAGYSSAAPTLLHHLALASRTATPEQIANRKLVSEAIAGGKLLTTNQVDAAWKYVSSTQAPSVAELEKESGVGVVVTKEDVEKAVRAYIQENKTEVEKQRYKALSTVLMAVKKLPSMKWASPALFKPAIDAEFLAVLGPKDERDNPKLQAKQAKAKASKDAKAPVVSAVKHEQPHARSIFREGFLAGLHRPGENEQADPCLMEAHLKATGGKVVTRFPPEPNGVLHIGHAKAIATDFGYAKYHGGVCYLRFDDTNPETEDAEFAKSIEDIVQWLGFAPYKITWSSDYFDALYELAEKLISRGLAYVCFCTPEQVKRHRGINEDGTRGGERTPCECRSASPERTLELFREMRDGKFKRGEATLRMKQDLSNPNPQMWDLVAYRIVDAPHHRTGTKWKIYPTYDFTHCLVDSFENISHSLCTLEFRLSRESYEWLCDAVQVYKPAQREFGRLNLTGSVMSKRKLLKLVEGGYVRGWDDPRLYTLVALRRRGVPPGAILNFISELGVTTTTSQTEVIRFDNSIRKYLENTVPRLMLIPDPIKVVLDNLDDDFVEEIVLPFKPGTPEMGEHKVPFSKVVYIDRSDFREEASSNYFRLAMGQSVGLLRVPYTIKATSVEKDANGDITVVHAIYENDGTAKKPKTFIQWVGESAKHNSPIKVAEVREFNQLFKSENPSANPDGFLADIDPNSEHVWKKALIEVGFNEVREKSPWNPADDSASKDEKIMSGHDVKGAPEAVRFQALRVGYFCMDKDSHDSSIVLNRIVTLKEDKSKE